MIRNIFGVDCRQPPHFLITPQFFPDPISDRPMRPYSRLALPVSKRCDRPIPITRNPFRWIWSRPPRAASIRTSVRQRPFINWREWRVPAIWTKPQCSSLLKNTSKADNEPRVNVLKLNLALDGLQSNSMIGFENLTPLSPSPKQYNGCATSARRSSIGDRAAD